MKFIKLFLPLVDIYLAFNIWVLKMFRKFLSKFNKKKADHGQDHDSDSDSTMKDLKNEIKERIRQRTKEFEKLNDLKLSFEKYKSKIKFVFENKNFRDELFSKFSDLWENKRIKEDKEIYAIITQVSIANAFLAGLPGKLVVGVYVCMALEFYMAIAIASRMGFDISDDKFQDKLWSKLLELSKYVGYFSIVAGTVFYVFRHMLSFVFSLVPAFLPATVIAEYIVTTFTGIFFWTLFAQTKKGAYDGHDSILLKINENIIRKSVKKTTNLLKYQKDSIKHVFSKENIIDTGQKLKAWFTGDFLEDLPKIRGEVFVSASIGYLLIGKHDALGGPVGQIFIQSIRDRWPKLEDASVGEIAEFMKEEYSDGAIPGVINQIKGKLFENLTVAHENADGDEWRAFLHEDESYPGSDMIMENTETGETIELSLKATENLNYIESSLLKYPEFPILTTSEIPEEYPDLEMVIASDFSHREIQEITESNFEELVDNLTPFSRLSGAAAVSFGVAGATAFSLWPFVVAYKRNKISLEQLKKACEKVFPKAGEELVYRLTLMAVLGPIYGWYVIAKTAMKLTPAPKDSPQKDTSVKYSAWKVK
ncbi:uncharacterized protein METZ01_LOCUS179906 [marine metagenome]|uniref:Uncharacterized protein n=1 Tax=marine metagenome TaxID=408172 RepID=A0A382CMP9_9ZZZZ